MNDSESYSGSGSPEPVDPDEIERLVGALRHTTLHIARANTEEGKLYLVHPHSCIQLHDGGEDYRTACKYSKCLAWGLDPQAWEEHLDRPVVVEIKGGQLVPGEGLG